MRLSLQAKIYIYFLLILAVILLFHFQYNSFQIDTMLVLIFLSGLLVSCIGILPLKNSINLISIFYSVIYFNYGILPVIILDLISLFFDKRILKSFYVFSFNLSQLVISVFAADYLYSNSKNFLPTFEFIHVLFFLSIYILINNLLVISIMLIADIFHKIILRELLVIYIICLPVYMIFFYSFKNNSYFTLISTPFILFFIKKSFLNKIKIIFDNNDLEGESYLYTRQFIFDYLSENNYKNFDQEINWIYLAETPSTDNDFVKNLRNVCGKQLFCRFTRDKILILSKDNVSKNLSSLNLKFVERKIILNENIDILFLILGLEQELDQFTRKTTRQREIALSKSVQLATIGQLAAGLAHEIRNPLTAVKGFLQLYRFGSRLDSDKIKLMQTELNRINQLVTDLLYLSAPTIDLNSAETHNLNHIIHEVAELLQPELANKSIVMHLELSPLPSLPIDRNQIKQVILNLLQNAIQAIDYKGQIVIKTEADNSQVLTTIIDNGPGIPASLQEKIFDPFFTTKNHGTGLGLTICRQLIIAHGGQINLRSSPGRTEVIITLPV